MQKFLLADDHPIIMLGIATIIRENLRDVVFDMSTSLKDVSLKLQEETYKTVILGVSMKNPAQINDSINLIQLYKSTPILVFVDDAANLPSSQFYRAGVRGILDKKAGVTEINKAIEAIYKGLTYVNAPFLKKTYAHNIAEKDYFEKLTSKEKIVAHLLIDGNNNKAIAEMLSLHQTTVSTFKQHIFKKLNIGSLIELGKLKGNMGQMIN